MSVEMCPGCGSTKVVLPDIRGGDAACSSCGWIGKDKDLVAKTMSETEAYSIANAVAREYLLRLGSSAAIPIGQAMIESGLVGRKDKQLITRLIRAAVAGAHMSTLKEIEKIQKELSSVKLT